MSVNVICSMTLFIGAFAALYLRGIGWRRINPFHPLNLGWSLELGLHLRTLLIFDNWGFAWVSHRSGIDYHWWHSCIVYCAWYNMYTTVGKSQGCRRTQKTFSWIQNFSRIMRLHQGYFFDFSYSQSVQTELKKWTVIFFFMPAGNYSVEKSSRTVGRWWALFPTWKDWSLEYFPS